MTGSGNLIHLGFVAEVEAGGFAVEDIGPRHEEGGTCQVGRDAVVLGKMAEVGKTALRVGDGLARVTLGDKAQAVTAGGNRHEIDRCAIRVQEFRRFRGFAVQVWEDVSREEVAGVVDMIDVEHDETGWDGVSRFAGAVTRETACVRRNDRQLTFETSELVGVVAIEEFDLVTNVLDTRVAHGGFDGGPEDRRRGA